MNQSGAMQVVSVAPTILPVLVPRSPHRHRKIWLSLVLRTIKETNASFVFSLIEIQMRRETLLI